MDGLKSKMERTEKELELEGRTIEITQHEYWGKTNWKKIRTESASGTCRIIIKDLTLMSSYFPKKMKKKVGLET